MILLLLITDGFLEWEKSAGEQFGTARFEHIIRSSCHLPPEEIMAEVYARVVGFAGGPPQQDDLTDVVIKNSCATR